MILLHQINLLVVETLLVFILMLLPTQFLVAVAANEMAFEQQLARVQEVKDSLTKKSANDLEQYERFANEVLSASQDGTREHSAILAQALCQPLTAGMFNDDRQYSVARELALVALKSVEQIAVISEIELTQNVSLLKSQPELMPREEFTKKRLSDAKVWLHAWNRFTSTLDPTWNPNEAISVHPEPPPGVDNFDFGASPQSISDPVLRAQYEMAVDEHNQRIQAQTIQHMLRHRLKNFPREAEQYLSKVYSLPPSDPSELKQLLNDYKIDDKTAERILRAVLGTDKNVNP